jgi:hypothetical protein
MAVRLINLHQKPLRVDLRGGNSFLLASGQRSVALREELLYDNCHLSEWERAGWISRVPASMSEVLAGHAAVAAPARKRAVASAAAVPQTSHRTSAAKQHSSKKR